MTTTNFNHIKFDPQGHTYRHINGKKLTGTTAYLKQFQKPFDRDGIATRVAAREGRTVASVLADWDAKGQAAIALGLKVHQYIETVLTAHKNGSRAAAQQAHDPFLAMNGDCSEIAAFETMFSQIGKRADVVQVEWVIGDAELGIAGTADALIFSHDTDKYHLWDWKTGKLDTENRFDTLLPPFHEFDACKLHVYSLQLSLYRLMIERNTGLGLGDSYLFHLSPAHPGGVHIYKAVDFRSLLVEHFNGR